MIFRLYRLHLVFWVINFIFIYMFCWFAFFTEKMLNLFEKCGVKLFKVNAFGNGLVYICKFVSIQFSNLKFVISQQGFGKCIGKIQYIPLQISKVCRLIIWENSLENFFKSLQVLSILPFYVYWRGRREFSVNVQISQMSGALDLHYGRSKCQTTTRKFSKGSMTLI